MVGRSDGNDILPVFSPDGKYLAFASNRSGVYDIYVLDLDTQTTYQLTNTIDEDYPSGWSQSVNPTNGGWQIARMQMVRVGPQSIAHACR